MEAGIGTCGVNWSATGAGTLRPIGELRATWDRAIVPNWQTRMTWFACALEVHGNVCDGVDYVGGGGEDGNSGQVMSVRGMDDCASQTETRRANSIERRHNKSRHSSPHEFHGLGVLGPKTSLSSA